MNIYMHSWEIVEVDQRRLFNSNQEQQIAYNAITIKKEYNEGSTHESGPLSSSRIQSQSEYAASYDTCAGTWTARTTIMFWVIRTYRKLVPVARP